MAQVTVELRNLLKTDFELFDFDYNFDDPQFKKKLEQSVIDYYYFYEIGQETPEAFKQRFKTRWLGMIDYYNKLYNTTLLNYNPLINYSMTEALEQLSQSNNQQNTTSNVEGENTSFSDAISKGSDYPQQPIAGGDYLSEANNTTTDINSTDKTTSIGTRTENNTVDTTYEKTIEGLTGTSYQELIQKERENLIRITSMVIEELKPCFILVY